MPYACNYRRATTAIAIPIIAALFAFAPSAEAAFGPIADWGPGREPHGALGNDGVLHIVYVDDAVRYMTLDGDVTSAVETLPGSSGGRNPFVAVGIDGSVHVVWDTWSMAYYTNRLGGHWKNPQALPAVMPQRNLFAQVAVASNGVAFTSHWSLTKNEAGYSVFSRVTNTDSASPTITRVYYETGHNRPPSIIGPSPVTVGDGNIHIFVGQQQTKHLIMDANGGVTGGANISRTPYQKTGEGLQGFFAGADPGVVVGWWNPTGLIEGAVVNTLSRANAGKEGLVVGRECGEFPYPRAAFDPLGNTVYILYPDAHRPALASWNPSTDTVQQLGRLTETGLSTDPRGPGAGGVAALEGGGAHLIYSTGGVLYHKVYDPNFQPPVVERKRVVATKPDSAPVIDGDLSDWDGADFQEIEADGWVGLDGAVHGGHQDLSADFAVRWTDDALHFAVRVVDDHHVNNASPEALWSGDSVQIGFDLLQDGGFTYDLDNDHEMGFALGADSPMTYRWHAPSSAALHQPSFGVVRSGNVTVYEVSVPLSQLQPLTSLEEGDTIGFSILVNDDDGSGRKGWLEWTPGMGRDKQPWFFGEILLGEVEGADDPPRDPDDDPDEDEKPSEDGDDPGDSDGNGHDDAGDGTDSGSGIRSGCAMASGGGPLPLILVLLVSIALIRANRRRAFMARRSRPETSALRRSETQPGARRQGAPTKPRTR